MVELKEFGLQIIETNEYDRLMDFFLENDLEYDDEEEAVSGIVKAYKLVDQDDNLFGGAFLSKRKGEFIINGIAVDESLRSKGIGGLLLNLILEDIKSLGGNTIYLAAKVPAFYYKNGFEPVDPDSSPIDFGCIDCPQYNKTCHPEVMKRRIENV